MKEAPSSSVERMRTERQPGRDVPDLDPNRENEAR